MSHGLSVECHRKRQQSSGLSIAEYCRKSGIGYWKLYEYIRKQRKPKSVTSSVPAISRLPVRFTEVSPVFADHQTQLIRLEFGGGITVVLPQGFNRQDLYNLVSVLNPCPDKGGRPPC